MLYDWEINVMLSAFKGRKKLMYIYFYDNYVFAIVSESIPQLRLAQVTRHELEELANTKEPAANLSALVAARCIINVDVAREAKVLNLIEDETKNVKTKDMLEVEVRRIVKELDVEAERQKTEERVKKEKETPVRKDLFDLPLDTYPAVGIKGVVETVMDISGTDEKEKPIIKSTKKGNIEKTEFGDLSDLLQDK